MIRLGLTGGIGMGKSTAAAIFAELGAAVWDADAAVHRLYAEGGAGVRPIEALVPGVVADGAVRRDRLRQAIGADPDLLLRVEAAIHPLVAADRIAFLKRAEAQGHAVALCDIPLLFETGLAGAFDAIVVVSATTEQQRGRVLARPGMTEETFEAIRAKQIPDAEKRAKAHFIVDASGSLDDMRRQAVAIMDWARRGADDA